MGLLYAKEIVWISSAIWAQCTIQRNGNIISVDVEADQRWRQTSMLHVC